MAEDSPSKFFGNCRHCNGEQEDPCVVCGFRYKQRRLNHWPTKAGSELLRFLAEVGIRLEPCTYCGTSGLDHTEEIQNEVPKGFYKDIKLKPWPRPFSSFDIWEPRYPPSACRKCDGRGSVPSELLQAIIVLVHPRTELDTRNAFTYELRTALKKYEEEEYCRRLSQNPFMKLFGRFVFSIGISPNSRRSRLP